MKHLLQFNLKTHLFCANCGSVFVYRLGLCEECFHYLITKFEITRFNHPNYTTIQVISFIKWIQDESIIKNRFLKAIKGPKSQDVWNEIGEEISFYKYKDLLPLFEDKKTAIIPVPSLNPDHSYFFSKTLSEIFNVEIAQPFYRVSITETKKMSKTERSQTNKIKVNENISTFLADVNHVILVDDIITTGSTTKEMISAIENKKITVLTLAYRDFLDQKQF